MHLEIHSSGVLTDVLYLMVLVLNVLSMINKSRHRTPALLKACREPIRSVADKALRTAVPYMRQGGWFPVLRAQPQTSSAVSGDRWDRLAQRADLGARAERRQAVEDGK